MSADRTRLLARRDFLHLSALGVAGWSVSGWLGALAAAADDRRRRSCILLWMAGGPAQTDTFDLKPGHKNGGPFRPISTSVPGIQISEHLPQLARQANRLAILRSMSTREGDHGRATYHLRTGYVQQPPIDFPPLGALMAKELGEPDADLPNFVSIAPGRGVNPAAYGAGFLGPRFAPLAVGSDGESGAGERSLKVQDLALPTGVRPAQAEGRVQLLAGLDQDFVAKHPDAGPRSHQAAWQGAVRLMKPSAARAFNLDDESSRLRDRYGRNLFGQGCLLARRLVERGVPFVEVALGGWDTHIRNFDAVQRLSNTLDPAFATLLSDLDDRGLLDSTLVVWMGEFGRTPQINGQVGRDHFPTAWSTVLAGGGIRGGQVVGKTSADGTTVEERRVPVPDFMATICRALGVDPAKQNLSNVGRPIRLADAGAEAVREVLP
ncbi:MAG: DUF1501 domain-containing protein [Planctomycetia bacterium]|nr:DUF1501 domain-containing protein [Planctomycetia bacterium]